MLGRVLNTPLMTIDLELVGSVIREKGESYKKIEECYKKTKHEQFSKKQTFLTSSYTLRTVLQENKAC